MRAPEVGRHSCSLMFRFIWPTDARKSLKRLLARSKSFRLLEQLRRVHSQKFLPQYAARAYEIRFVGFMECLERLQSGEFARTSAFNFKCDGFTLFLQDEIDFKVALPPVVHGASAGIGRLIKCAPTAFPTTQPYCSGLFLISWKFSDNCALYRAVLRTMNFGLEPGGQI